ncbi:MAG TPA: AbrB family transcriptional regulator [Candidatus Dormibacteraeota bacterium]|nr:AbrB family transcriptional regulator [Candidatus Dormibacteraeota bacterium]
MAKARKKDYLLQVSPRGTITLPKELRGQVSLLAAVRRDDGVIELRPQIAIDESQAWFWTPKWQRMEREAQEDVAAGRVAEFDDFDQFTAHLEHLERPRRA